MSLLSASPRIEFIFILGTFFWSLSRLFSRTQVFFKAAFLTRLRIIKPLLLEFCKNELKTQKTWQLKLKISIQAFYLWTNKNKYCKTTSLLYLVSSNMTTGLENKKKPSKQNSNKSSQTVIILHAWVIFCRRVFFFIKNKSSLERGASDRHAHLTVHRAGAFMFIFFGDNRQKHLSFFDNLGTNSLSGRLRAIFKTVKKANSSSK